MHSKTFYLTHSAIDSDGWAFANTERPTDTRNAMGCRDIWNHSFGTSMHPQDDGSMKIGLGEEENFLYAVFNGCRQEGISHFSADILFLIKDSVSLFYPCKDDAGSINGNNCYLFSFKDDDVFSVMLYRIADNALTPVTDYIPFADIADSYDYNNFEFGADAEEGGVRVTLKVNGKDVINYFDEGADPIMAAPGSMVFGGGYSVIYLRGTDDRSVVSHEHPLRKIKGNDGREYYDITDIGFYTAKKMFQLFDPKTFVSSEGFELPYRLYLPMGYSEDRKYPLFMLLHGGGLRGTDNMTQLKGDHTNLRMIFDYELIEPFVCIVPQCKPDRFWGNSLSWKDGNYNFVLNEETDGEQMRALAELTKYMISSYSVDPARVYCGGGSMGGMASYELIYRYPGLFTSAYIGCARSDISKADIIAKTPVYIAHGQNDDTIPVRFSRIMAEELKLRGADFVYNEIPGRGHDFTSRQLLLEICKWVFSKRKPSC